ncbi:oxidoreductase [Trypanosoma cruzi Dm28c]|uniref:Oxidoreductase n=2 Tax=Trypanosoma cruzi TaxID=5693 RepID=V5ALK9_TRYCR|nr:oxidoreductase [Trypanosoma cruzi Dm28c]PWU95667.1 putative oxidoreductase [Trypanosoma cruzi]
MGAVSSQAQEKQGMEEKYNNNDTAPEGHTIRCEGWTIEKPIRSWSASAMVYVDNVMVPPPGPGQVRVKIYAASVNPVDVKRPKFGRNNGFFSWCNENFGKVGKNSNSNIGAGVSEIVSTFTRHEPPEFPFPYVMGTEGAGVVESVGWDNDDMEQRERYGLQVGDRVAFLADITMVNGGTFCQYALAMADSVGRIPSPTTDDVIGFLEAAVMPCAVGTAYVALFDKLRVSSGRSIFISGASGGIGSAAVQLAKYAGMYVLASCSTVNVAYVKSLGADYVFDYTASDVVGECLAHTRGFGVDYVLEVADAALAVHHADALRFGGSICVLPEHMPISSEVFFRRQLSICYVCLTGLHADPLTRGNLRHVVETCMKLYQLGAFQLQLETVPVERADTALDIISAGHTRGKIVLTIFHPDDMPCGDDMMGTRRRKHAKVQSGQAAPAVSIQTAAPLPAH